MSYCHLSSQERYVISHLVLHGLSMREIGRRLQRHHAKEGVMGTAVMIYKPYCSFTRCAMPICSSRLIGVSMEMYGRRGRCFVVVLFRGKYIQPSGGRL